MSNASNERRRVASASSELLKQGLSQEQLATLLQLERFGWILKFVREDQQARLVAVYDPDHDRFVALQSDGTVDTDPPVRFRH